MRDSFDKLDLYLSKIPDRLYPFKAEIEGKFVRGQRAYQHALEAAWEKYGLGSIGYKLMLYRQTWHLVGSLVVIFLATLLVKEFFSTYKALYFLFVIAILIISYQEFYLHPKHYGQKTKKGIVDWLSWIVPMSAYLYLFT